MRKRGSPAREGFPWNALLIQNRVLEGRSLLQSAPLLQNNPPDCSAIHSPQSALRVSTSEAVKSSPMSVSRASGGLCPLDTHKPFFEGLDPKIYDIISRKLPLYSHFHKSSLKNSPFLPISPNPQKTVDKSFFWWYYKQTVA